MPPFNEQGVAMAYQPVFSVLTVGFFEHLGDLSRMPTAYSFSVAPASGGLLVQPCRHRFRPCLVYSKTKKF